MPGKNPITINDILAVTDTARHSIAWMRGYVSIRALTLREFLRLAQRHPSLTRLVDEDFSTTTEAEIISAFGRPAIVEVLALSMGKGKWRFRYLPDVALTYGLFKIDGLTFGVRKTDDYFTEARKSGDGNSSGDPAQSRLMTIVRDAAEYSVRTGQDGLDLSPARLAFAIRTIAELNRTDRIGATYAASAAQGDKKSTEFIGAIW